jgi:hypothetical protein
MIKRLSKQYSSDICATAKYIKDIYNNQELSTNNKIETLILYLPELEKDYMKLLKKEHKYLDKLSLEYKKIDLLNTHITNWLNKNANICKELSIKRPSEFSKLSKTMHKMSLKI